MLDGGIVGLLVCLLCGGGFSIVAIALLRDTGDRVLATAGPLSTAAVVTVCGFRMTDTSFLFKSNDAPYLCVVGAALRAHQGRRTEGGSA